MRFRSVHYGKNIVLFIDGTGNELHATGHWKNSNVGKLFHALEEKAQVQEKKYLTGVGTDCERIEGRLFLELATGLGISLKIKTAYRYLSSLYKTGDNIFLFGFSRGAFAVRSLTGFINHVGGLLKDADDKSVEELYGIYLSEEDPTNPELAKRLKKLTGKSKAEDERDILPLYFVGVWDTVRSLGLSGKLEFLTASYAKRHKTELPIHVTHARHALAIHELRNTFQPLLWQGCGKWQTLKQTWFPGAHSDVGGSYLEHTLSDVALAWMIQEAMNPNDEKGTFTPALLLKNPGPNLNGNDHNPPTIHHEIRGLLYRLFPRPRDVLKKPDADPVLLNTFSVHSSARMHLLKKENRNYAVLKRTGKNIREALQTADDCALQLLLKIEFKNDPSHNWWQELTTRHLDYCQEVVSRYLSSSHRNQRYRSNELMVALSLLFLCAGPDFLNHAEGNLKKASEQKSKLIKSHGDLDALDEWTTHLKSVVDVAADATSLLPLHKRNEMEYFCKKTQCLAHELQSLSVGRRISLGLRYPIKALAPMRLP